jgi:hypothetical protein
VIEVNVDGSSIGIPGRLGFESFMRDSFDDWIIVL